MDLEQKREKWQLKWWLEFVNAIYNMFLFIIRSVVVVVLSYFFFWIGEFGVDVWFSHTI